MRRIMVIMAVVLSVVAAGVRPAAGAAADPRQAAMDAVAAAGIPGMLGVAADPDGGWRGVSGVGDLRTGAAPRASGRFRIGSVSKTFVATLVLKLAGEGRFGLDDPVGRYLPGLLPYPEPITIRQLLQHTSGLPRDLAPRYTWETLPEVDTERFVHFGEAEAVHGSTVQPLLFAPGTAWSYSNTGYNVLAMLVERVGHAYLERLLATDITGPLRLRDTFLPRDVPLLPGAAQRGYEQLYPAPHPLTDVTVYNYSRYFGAGDIVSSAADLNRFFAALLGGRLLTRDMLRQMETTVPAVQDGVYAGFDYGLGLMRVDLGRICGAGAPAMWGHGGDVFGFNTWSFHDVTATRNITTSANEDVTAPPAAQQLRVLVAVNEFCAPDLSGMPAFGYRMESVFRSGRS
jgi:D-alanyl-D-alanine carboxypeptidase